MSRRFDIIKLGGSLITDKRRERAVRRATLRRLAAELAAAFGRTRRGWLVGHGSGSFGHHAARLHGTHTGMKDRAGRLGLAATQAAAAELHTVVVDALRDAGIAAFSVAPSSTIVSRAGKPVAVADAALIAALEQGMVPVIYGDVVLDRERGCAICSTETALLAFERRLRRAGWRASQAYWFGDTDGIWAPDGKIIQRIALRDGRQALRAVQGSAAPDVTGGMRLRLQTALALARRGVTSHIVDGNVEGEVGRVLGGARRGTRIVP